jgi:mono/diheme cytochrome c family protein
MPPPVPADFERGRQVYDRWCAACHARDPGHPGTQSLEIKYGGAIPAALEDRSDLTPQITAHFVRNGAGLMPFFRRTEIGDADLRDLSAYLAEDE